MTNWEQISEEDLVRVGREALRSLKYERAREVFHEYTERLSAEARPVPAGVLANYALALGHCRRLKEGIALCQTALKADRRVPEVYYCMAQLYLLAKSRKEAWEALHRGLSYGPAHKGLLQVQREMGVRGTPPLPFLHRDNAINVRMGKALRRKKSRPGRPSGAAT
jgi:tetratricopeptide (TPR) repeat protein